MLPSQYGKETIKCQCLSAIVSEKIINHSRQLSAFLLTAMASPLGNSKGVYNVLFFTKNQHVEEWLLQEK